jgi:hypothetical protein
MNTSGEMMRGTIQVAHESERINRDDNNDEDQEPMRLVTCSVTLGRIDDDLSYQDLVQCFKFQDFDGLFEFMVPLRELILKRHPETLRVVHERLSSVAQEIVDERNLTGNFGRAIKVGGQVAPFATPNVRLRQGGYATFLHADAVFPESKAASRSMINIWIPLGIDPISNFPLCFYKCSRKETVFGENKLYYCGQENTNLRLAHVPDLQWGSFLCFVAGQSIADETILLHGAVHVEDPRHDRSFQTKKEPRRSVELRYLL